MKKTVICPGSFDPATLGHVDIIKRASKMFDRVIVAVLVNSSKSPSFSIDERIELLEEATKDIDNVEIASFDGLLAQYCKERGVNAIVKGLRAVSDFDYEFQMANTNKKLNGLPSMKPSPKFIVKRLTGSPSNKNSAQPNAPYTTTGSRYQMVFSLISILQSKYQ